MGKRLWPRLADLRLSFDLLSRANAEVWVLSDASFHALMAMVSFSAARLVWTYSPPSDGSIPDEDSVLAKVAGVTPEEWKAIRPDLEPFFTIRKRKWLLNRAWIAIDDRSLRFAIPRQIQRAVLSREGRVCTYCGDSDGPFDLDHIFPLSRGGSDAPSNLTLACATCNRSKGGRTLAEWMAAR
jgi:hypothetical protein